jgi:4-diphosphocytidyl-2C-methyl-D-erythritol kinase
MTPLTSLAPPASSIGSPLRVRSYAKINWTLDVLFRRPDGFHEIRTIYQTVSLYDTLVLSEIPERIEVTCDKPGVPCDASNLACRAAALLKESTGVGRGVKSRSKSVFQSRQDSEVGRPTRQLHFWD